MASIDASTAGVGGVITTSDNTGNLNIQSGGSTKIAVTSAGVAVTGTLSSSGATTFPAGSAASPAITTTGDTNTGMFFPAADTIAFSEGGTESMRLNSNGNLALQGATTSATGVGITFPATQSASTDANCLDDYEEGTWTPTQGSGVTRSGALDIGGTYTKIGRVVYVKGYLGATVSVTSVGQLVSGLPFSADYSTLGGATNNASNIGVTMIASGTSITSPIAISSTPYIYFAVIYNVS